MILRLIQLITAVLILVTVLYHFFPKNGSATLAHQETTIADLLAHSTDYDGKAVSVTGIVSKNASILGYGGYKLKQGDRELLVISTTGIPPIGRETTVSGVFKQAFSVNNYSYPVLLQN